MASEASINEAATYPRGFASGTDWKWPLVPARKLVKLNYGRALKADNRSLGKVPVFGTNGQCGWHNKSLAEAPGLILGRKGQGPLGVEWCKKDFWVIDTAYYASTLTHDVDLKFLYHLIKYIGLNHLKDGTSNPTLSRDTFGAQLFPIPPLPAQKRIARILGTLDDKIELNRRMNATLEATAQVLYQSWFVDFDPVKRNAKGEVSSPEDCLFPDSFEDSEMGEVPKGWKIKPLDQIADYQNGLALQKFRPGEDEEPLPIVKIAQLKTGEATWDEVASPSINPACIIDTGDVVFSWSGSLVVTVWCGGRAALNQHLFKVTSDEYPKWFYLHWTQKHLGDFQRIAEDKAVTMGHIKRNHLSEAMCVVPDAKALQEGTRRIAPLIEQIIALETQSRTLSTLRDTLLPKLLSGEVKVSCKN